MEDIQSLILTELRELRTAYANNARETGERLAVLGEKMYELAGNGKPGRVGKLEEAVEALQRWRWTVLGGAATVAAIISAFLR